MDTAYTQPLTVGELLLSISNHSINSDEEILESINYIASQSISVNSDLES